jgi:hypothetical protein
LDPPDVSLVSVDKRHGKRNSRSLGSGHIQTVIEPDLDRRNRQAPDCRWENLFQEVAPETHLNQENAIGIHLHQMDAMEVQVGSGYLQKGG